MKGQLTSRVLVLEHIKILSDVARSCKAAIFVFCVEPLCQMPYVNHIVKNVSEITLASVEAKLM